MVDEITKQENDEVEFQYKQGTDTYETLQDRLQRLHKDGMEKFMREKIFMFQQIILNGYLLLIQEKKERMQLKI